MKSGETGGRENAALDALLARARQGDADAFGELYRQFYPRVRGLCRHFLGSPEAAEDAAAEVFLRAQRAMRTYDSALPFPRWLLSIANPAASIGGKTDIKVVRPRRADWTTPRFYVQKAIGLAIVFLLGLLVFWAFPALRSVRVAGGAELAKATGVGFLAFVAPPVAAFVLFIVLIGIGILAKAFLIATLIPILITVLWLLTLYLSKVVVGLTIGQAIVKSAEPARIAVPLLVGLVVVYILVSLPVVGHALNFCVWLIGLGVGILHFWRLRRPAAPPPLPA